jgi:hypothetical protein
MFKKDRPKDPKKVAAGQAAHRKLTAGMSKDEYRAFQQRCREQALAKAPTMQERGAATANRAQLQAWGVDTYIKQRKTAYQACVDKHGEAVTKRAIRAAHLQRRGKRLERPTPGEATLRALLTDLGFTVHLDPEPFDFSSWRNDPSQRALNWRDALAEGGVGPYFCDVLLPVLALAIEVEGGVHVLGRERDARRRAFLEAQGLTVIVVSDTDDHPLDLAAVVAQLTPYLPDLQNVQASRRAA